MKSETIVLRSILITFLILNMLEYLCELMSLYKPILNIQTNSKGI